MIGKKTFRKVEQIQELEKEIYLLEKEKCGIMEKIAELSSNRSSMDTVINMKNDTLNKYKMELKDLMLYEKEIIKE